MGTNRLVWLGRPRPVNIPTMLSLLFAIGLLAVALALPEMGGHKASVAAGLPTVTIAPVRPRQTVTLRDRLIVGLQARLDSEVEFVEQVALRVHSGQLPQRLVDETFFWARQRAAVGRQGRPRRPILFFQPAMRARADRLNVDL